MSAGERAMAEAQAERALRRGELTAALAAFESLARAFPDDLALSRRVAEIRELLHPAELLAPSGPAPASAPPAAVSLEHQGEALFAQGDYLGAAAAYRKALALRPDSELIQERLLEIFRLAQATVRPPRDREGLLRELLSRVGTRRRPG